MTAGLAHVTLRTGKGKCNRKNYDNQDELRHLAVAANKQTRVFGLVNLVKVCIGKDGVPASCGSQTKHALPPRTQYASVLTNDAG